MRGQALQVEELMKLFLVFLVGLGVVILVLNATGHLDSLIRDFCEKNPQFCENVGYNYTNKNVRIALASMEALQCAINSVAEQKVEGWESCVSKYEEARTSPLSGAVLAQEVETENATVNCIAPGRYISIGPNKAKALRDIGLAMLSCFRHAKEGEDFLCNTLKTKELEQGITITETDIRNWLNDEGGSEGSDLIGNGIFDLDNLEVVTKTISKNRPVLLFLYSDNSAKNEVFIVDDWQKIPKGTRTEHPGEKTGEVGCTVHDFFLPQEVSNYEDWILFFGDPEMIGYWNSFPIEEDTWTFRPSWATYGLMAAISVLPFGKIVGYSGKILGTLRLGPGTGAARVAVAEFFGMSERQLVNELGKKGANALAKDFIREFGKKEFTKKLIKAALYDTTIGRVKKLTGRKILYRGVEVTVLEAGVYAAALIDNMSEKFIPIGNSLALKVVRENKKQFPLVTQLNKTPVMVKWSPEGPQVIGNTFDLQNTHFVSPCKLNQFQVNKQSLACGEYSYSSDDEVVTCTKSEITSEADVACGDFSDAIDGDYIGTYGNGESTFSQMERLTKDTEKLLFEHVPNEVKYDLDPKYNLTKMYLPWLSKTNPVFLDNFKRTGDNNPGGGPGANPTYDVFYEARLNTGNADVGLEGVTEENKVIMKAGEEYVLNIYWLDDTGPSNDVVVDVYPVSICAEGGDFIDTSTESLKWLSCSQISDLGNTESVTAEWIGGVIADVFNNENNVRKKVIPQTDITPANIGLVEPGKLTNLNFDMIKQCDGYSLGSVLCYRVPQDVKIKFKCRTTPFGSSLYRDVNGIQNQKQFLDTDENTCIIENGLDFPVTFQRNNIGEPYSTMIFDLGSSKQIMMTDDDLDGKWDSLQVSKGLSIWYAFKPGGRENIITLSNIGADGEIGHIAMKNCNTDAIIVGVDIRNDIDKSIDPNYCLRHQSKTAVVLDWIGAPVAIGGIIAAGFFTGGTAWAIAAGTALTGVWAEAYSDFQPLWPS